MLMASVADHPSARALAPPNSLCCGLNATLPVISCPSAQACFRRGLRQRTPESANSKFPCARHKSTLSSWICLPLSVSNVTGIEARICYTRDPPITGPHLRTRRSGRTSTTSSGMRAASIRWRNPPKFSAVTGGPCLHSAEADVRSPRRESGFDRGRVKTRLHDCLRGQRYARWRADVN